MEPNSIGSGSTRGTVTLARGVVDQGVATGNHHELVVLKPNTEVLAVWCGTR